MNPLLRSCLFATLPLVACESTVTVQPTVSTTSSGVDVVSVDRAARNIASARCSRELSCGNIGLEGMNDCVDTVRNVTQRSLVTRCASGVAAGYLSSCLENVRNEVCGRVETLPDRLGSTCVEAKLCL